MESLLKDILQKMLLTASPSGSEEQITALFAEQMRPFVDEVVYHLCEEGELEINKETKAKLLGILTCDTFFPKVTRPLQIGLSITMESLAKCYAGKQKNLSLPMLK